MRSLVIYLIGTNVLTFLVQAAAERARRAINQ